MFDDGWIAKVAFYELLLSFDFKEKFTEGCVMMDGG